MTRARRLGKTGSLIVLVLCEVGGMSVWFSAAAIVGIIEQSHTASSWQITLLTSAVQAGFVFGTISSALLALADRYDPRHLFALSALTAGLATGCLALLEPVGPAVIILRFVTGACMAGVYPVGMRLAASWAKGDLGLLIGILVGALTLGSAAPHGLAAVGGWSWRAVYGIAASLACLSGIAILACTVGPNLTRAARINLDALAEIWRNKAIRLANLGYLGHMWELYAMWAWLAVFLQSSFLARALLQPRRDAEILAAAAIGAGAVGAWLGGVLADRLGRTAVTIGAMAASGTCAVVMGLSFGGPVWIVAPIAILWGITVIADSAQFSASIAELSAPASVGTLLTAQTCAGFLLTLVSIHLVPVLVSRFGWAGAFSTLAGGPLLGCIAMAQLRGHPDSRKLAGGRR
ncbi:MAG: MFS transporter [Burkholderiaceae bacterium]